LLQKKRPFQMPAEDQALDMASMGQRFDQLSSTTRAAWTMVAHERPNRAQRQVYTFQQDELAEHQLPDIKPLPPQASIASVVPSNPSLGGSASTRQMGGINVSFMADAYKSLKTASGSGMLPAGLRPSSGNKLPPLGDSASEKELLVSEGKLDDKYLLATCADAVEFFGRKGQQSDIKVLFLNRAREEHLYRPYDLVVCNRNETENEYFTMSATGLVRMKPGQPSEFVSLGDWWRCTTMFDLLRSIHYFKHYLAAKTFRTWHSNVRFKKYSQQRNRLVKRLFLAKKSFCPTLLELNKQCHELRCVRFIDLDWVLKSSAAIQIEEFASQQAVKRTAAAKGFEAIVDKMQVSSAPPP
jgi:hypothetical protein